MAFLTAADYVGHFVVHGLCKSGNHDVCKGFEEWNLRAMNSCACSECDHPKPSEEQLEKFRNRLASDRPAKVQSASNQKRSQPAADPNATENTEMATKTKDDKSTKSKASSNGDRRGRGELEERVLEVTDAFEKGDFKVEDDKPLTPHRIAKQIQENRGLEKPPSTGAVSAVLKRWDENYGFALTDDKPYAFRRYSAAGKKQGLDALKEKHREKLKEERAAEKAKASK